MKKTYVLCLVGCVLVLMLSCQMSGGGGERGSTLAAPTIAAPQTQSSQPQAAVSSSTLPQGRILFRDDFQDGQPDGWKINSGWNINQNGEVYVFSVNGTGSAWVTSGGRWQDYLFSTAARLDSGTLSLNFRLNSQGRYYLVYTQDGLILAKEQPRGNTATLARANAPSLGASHWFVIGCEGGHLQVYVDRTMVMDYTDPIPLADGSVGVGTGEGTQASIDNVIVAELDGHLPTARVAQQQPAPAGGAAPAPAGPALDQIPPASEAQQGAAAQPAVPAQVRFTVEDQLSATIDTGQCVTTEWTVTNAQQVYYQNHPVALHEARDECPTQTTTYTLEVTGLDGRPSEHSVTVNVNAQGNNPDPNNGGGGQGENADITVNANLPGNFLIAEMPITVNVSNRGTLAAGAFNVRFLPDRNRNDVVGCSWDIASLAAGQNVQQTCRYAGYPQAGTFEWQIIADADHEVTESNENNNIASGRITIRGGQNNGGEPDAPVNCTAANITANSMVIRWGINNNVQRDGFRIYQGVTSLETSTDTRTLQTTIGNLAPATQYHFDVRTVSGNQESAADACAVDATTR